MYFDAAAWSAGACLIGLMVEGARVVAPFAVAAAAAWLAARGAVRVL